MPLNKWHYIFKSASDGKCPLEVAWHLWTPVQGGESSLTGQACRTMCRASWKLPATPEKVAALKKPLNADASFDDTADSVTELLERVARGTDWNRKAPLQAATTPSTASDKGCRAEARQDTMRMTGLRQQL
ncbi:uncharacterized protein LOC142579902 isoform X2 [Dermacentor variabilis]